MPHGHGTGVGEFHQPRSRIGSSNSYKNMRKKFIRAVNAHDLDLLKVAAEDSNAGDGKKGIIKKFLNTISVKNYFRAS